MLIEGEEIQRGEQGGPFRAPMERRKMEGRKDWREPWTMTYPYTLL
jgi:hypothetical protein